jgi:hypothetical protein
MHNAGGGLVVCPAKKPREGRPTLNLEQPR